MASVAQESAASRIQRRIHCDPASKAMGGLLGGAVATLALHPLDLLKLRQAVYCNTGTATERRAYSTVRSGFFELCRCSGSGSVQLYKGVGINVALSATSWGIYFFNYGLLTSKLKANRSEGLCTAELFGAAFGAGVITTVMTNPMTVVRTRIMMINQASGKAQPRKSALAVARDIWLNEGRRAFGKGLFPALLNVTHGAIQISLYETFKKTWFTQDREPNAAETVMMTALSKAMSSLVTYPCQTIRANQQANNAKNFSARALIRQEGIKGLYRGLQPSLLHVIPNVCIVFLVYEMVNKVNSTFE